MTLRHITYFIHPALLAAAAGKSQLDRTSLPNPRNYLIKQDLLKFNFRGEWVSIRCPSHKNGAESHPSLRVNLIDGHFRCMACGARGGDVVSLHRLITGLSFRDAVRDLGGRFHD